jgi:hypothetical protein
VWFGETSRLLEGGTERPELQPQGHGLQPESGRLAALGGGERAPGRRGAAGAGRGGALGEPRPERGQLPLEPDEAPPAVGGPRCGPGAPAGATA